MFSVHVSRLQCCGLKVRESPSSTVPQRQEVCGPPGARDWKDPVSLSPLLTLSDSPGPPFTMLAHHTSSTNTDPGLPNMENGLCNKLNHTKRPGGVKSASIRDKISQWEGKKEVTPLNSTGMLVQTTTQKEVETVKKKETKASEVQRTDSKRFVSWDRQDSGKENVGKRSDSRPKSPVCSTNKDKEVVLEKSFRVTKPTEQPQEKKTVLTHIKKLEKATKDVPDRPSLAFPGNYFSPPSKEEVEESEKKVHEPIFGTFDVAQPGRSQRCKGGDPENVYSEPGAPSINPLPKPQRTFQHHTPPPFHPSLGKGRRNLPPLPSLPPPPLPTCPPPGVCKRPWAEKSRNSNNRYEKNITWYCSHNEKQQNMSNNRRQTTGKATNWTPLSLTEASSEIILTCDISCVYHVSFPLLHFEHWGKHPHICCKSHPPPPSVISSSL